MATTQLKLDADGFMQQPEDWTREIAEAIAEREGAAPLGADHWRIIDALRAHYFASKTLPVMRRICAEAGLEQHCVSDLLDNPQLAWRIAGLPNPGEEALAYMETAELPDSPD